jgi:hypothetical protein
MANGTLTDDGSTEWITLENGRGMISLDGDFGGGTLQVQVENENEGQFDVTDGAFSAAAVSTIDLGAQCRIRLTLAGSTNPDMIWEIRTQRRV